MRKQNNKGFTMIELLVVIAVIGVLAVAVLSAINPIEQINKGRDTGRRSDAGEFIGAVDRYYASIGWYPWETESTTPPTSVNSLGTAWVDADVLEDTAVPPVTALQKMVDTNEIKIGLKSRLESLGTTDKLKVYFEGGTSGASVYTCFLPKSSAFLTEAATRCEDTDGYGEDAPDVLGDSGPCPATCSVADPVGCYVCLP